MLNVPGMNTFLKLEAQAMKEAKPSGLSRSQDMKTGPSPLLDSERVDSQRPLAFCTRSLEVIVEASRPPL